MMANLFLHSPIAFAFGSLFQSLLSAAPLAARTYYDIARLRTLDQWWHWLLLAAIVISLVAFVTTLYRRDSYELSRSVRWLLLFLRLAAFVGLLVFFLKIEKRTEQKLVKGSRAVLLIDTSQSMGLSDPSADSRPGTRLEKIQGILSNDMVDALRKSHDVAIYSFDQQDRPREVALLGRTTRLDDDEPELDGETRAAGVHSISFDASALPSGVYVVRLATDGTITTQRMTVVR